MIGSTPGQRVKQLEIRTWKANGWQRSQLVEVAIKEPVVETPVNPSLSSLPTKQSRSPSKHQFLSEDGVDNVFDMNYPPMEPMILPQKKDMWKGWGLQVPRLVQQWTGDFFEDSALHMTGLQLHLGHDGALCPSASMNVQATLCRHSQPAALDEEEWEDIDYIPLHLRLPVGSKYLTVIDVTGKAITSSYSMQSYIHQPLKSQAQMWDIWHELLQQASLGDLQELLWVAQQWGLLKLLKWSGYQGNLNDLMKGDLALFCTACPQLGINLSPQANLDDWRYTRTVVMDGNFKAEHMSTTPHIMEKSACNNHKAISQTSASHGKLNSTGVGATACVWHGCFYPHSIVDFQKGKRLNEAVPSSQQENWWRQEEAALKDCVHDPSVMDIFEIQLTKVHGIELHLLQTSAASGMHHRAASWLTRRLVIKEAEVALSISRKALGPNPSDLKRLVITRHADRVTAEQKTFIMDGRIYLQMDTALDDSEESDRNHEAASQNIFVDDNTSSNGGNSDCSADDMQDTDTFMDPTSPTLPLPSNLGANRCHNIGIHQLAEMELELHIAQANDALHGLHLALADKAVIFRGVVRSATNYSMRTWAWQMVHSIDGTAMIALGAKPEILEQYQELQKSHLTTSTAAFTQGVHDHQASQLPRFWSIDIPRDTSSKSWLTEFYRIHWLCAKTGKDSWEEEEELLTSEFQWVINYF
ncbi:hypothetical protein F5141DRAFT_1065637 [Pisolithus sp. B1]|nr:hypothetical protein F5141DRAFT_1065637 [Pisolithus sp. B1]